ncbi:hypothetical protein ACFVJM_37000, partial [Streptomyces virginiae]
GLAPAGSPPLRLPPAWPVQAPPVAADMPYVLVGSGRRRGKLIAPGKLFAQLPGAELIEGLAL